jgi:DNA replication protein DnaC
MSDDNRLSELLLALKMPFAARQIRQPIDPALSLDATTLVVDALQAEVHERQERKRQRLQRQSQLPHGKTFDSWDSGRVPLRVSQKLRELTTGAFLATGDNILCFGLPGRGKTHAAAALGHALVANGHSVLFLPAFRLVQQLLDAKRQCQLPKALAKLDSFELIILDDIGYIQQTADEIEVLFTLLAERYERRSLLITSNLVFSEWNRIFHHPMTTAAAIDRLVHHCTVLEFTGRSLREEEAQRRHDADVSSPKAANQGATA